MKILFYEVNEEKPVLELTLNNFFFQTKLLGDPVKSAYFMFCTFGQSGRRHSDRNVKILFKNYSQFFVIRTILYSKQHYGKINKKIFLEFVYTSI